MDLDAVMDELAACVDQCPTLTGRTHSWPKGSVKAPAALIAYPESIKYNQAAANGLDVMDPSIVILIDRIDTKATRSKASKYTSYTGPDSIHRRLDDWSWQSCSFVLATETIFDDYPVGNIEYLAQVWRLRVVGSGST